MTFLRLTPDVPGELGERTRLDPSVHPPRVDTFHFDVSNWFGDDLVECFPCFAVTPTLAATLESAHLSGYSIGEMVTTENSDQRELHATRRAPTFRRLVISGIAGRDDAGIDAAHDLIVSARMWALLQRFNVSRCDAAPWSVD